MCKNHFGNDLNLYYIGDSRFLKSQCTMPINYKQHKHKLQFMYSVLRHIIITLLETPLKSCTKIDHSHINFSSTKNFFHDRHTDVMLYWILVYNSLITLNYIRTSNSKNIKYFVKYYAYGIIQYEQSNKGVICCVGQLQSSPLTTIMLILMGNSLFHLIYYCCKSVFT